MHDDVFGDTGEPAFAGVEHLLDIVNALGIVVEELHGDAHAIAGVKFAEVSHMGFKREE